MAKRPTRIVPAPSSRVGTAPGEGRREIAPQLEHRVGHRQEDERPQVPPEHPDHEPIDLRVVECGGVPGVDVAPSGDPVACSRLPSPLSSTRRRQVATPSHCHRPRRRRDDRDRAPWAWAPRLPDPDAPVVRRIDVCRIRMRTRIEGTPRRTPHRALGRARRLDRLPRGRRRPGGRAVRERVREDADAKRQRLDRHPSTPKVAEEEAQPRGVAGGPERGGDDEPALDELRPGRDAANASPAAPARAARSTPPADDAPNGCAGENGTAWRSLGRLR